MFRQQVAPFLKTMLDRRVIGDLAEMALLRARHTFSHCGGFRVAVSLEALGPDFLAAPGAAIVLFPPGLVLIS